MKLKTFAMLLITCCILLAVVLLVSRPQKTADQSAVMGARLLDRLAVGEIAALTVTSPEATTGLKQTDAGWIVANRFDYPTDFSKVVELVQKLSDAKIGRTFPASPEIQARLSLYPPEQPEPPSAQKGTRIVLADANGKTLADLIIGKPREESSAAGSGAYYVLLPPENQVYLIDQNFQFLEKNPAGWLNKKPIDLNPKRIQKVVCVDTRRNRPVYTLARPAEDREPVLSDLPKGKITAKFKADQVFEALTSLTVEDVADHGRKDTAAHSGGAPRFDYHLYDGTVYHVFTGAALKDDPEKHYFRVEVGYQPPPEAEPAQKESQAKLAEEAERLNRKLSPWTYVVSKWVYDSFLTDPDNLMETVDKK